MNDEVGLSTRVGIEAQIREFGLRGDSWYYATLDARNNMQGHLSTSLDFLFQCNPKKDHGK